MRDRLNLFTGYIKKPKRMNWGFVFRLQDADTCVVILTGSNHIPPYDAAKGRRPDVVVTVNGKQVYKGKSRFPNLSIDPNSGAVLSSPEEWRITIPPRLLRKTNRFRFALVGSGARYRVTVNAIMLLLPNGEEGKDGH